MKNKKFPTIIDYSISETKSLHIQYTRCVFDSYDRTFIIFNFLLIIGNRLSKSTYF